MVQAAARTQSVSGEAIAKALDGFPGIVAGPDAAAGSHAHVEAERVVLALRFADDQEGEVARMVADFIFSHMGNGRRLDGRAPIVPEHEPPYGPSAADLTWYVCTHQQAATFARMLRYASPEPQGPARPKRVLRTQPLSTLLSHAFAAFERGFEEMRLLTQPSLGIWSNVLRAIPHDGLNRRDFSKRTVISKRAASGVLRDAERLGWLTIEKNDRTAVVRLTGIGSQARDAMGALIQDLEADWEKRFGSKRMATLRAALGALVAQFDIELPWCLTGYGPADASITGGNHIAAKPGPPRIPHHGQDWPVVLRKPNTDVSQQPLPALLSQALASFTIDYEWEIFGYGAGLNATANLLQYVPDEGISLGDATARGEVSGNGKAGAERHLVAVVEPGKPRDMTRRVLLTPKGKRARDSYAYLATQVERDWRKRYGDCVGELRTALEAVDGQLGEGLPDYPDTTKWFFHSMVAASPFRK